MKQTFIISGMYFTETPENNKFRHEMLREALKKAEFEDAVEGRGYAAGFEEKIFVLTSNHGFNSEEWDMLGTLALAYGQDYLLFIENDVCYQVDPLTLDRKRLGIWWKAGKGCPEPVMEKIRNGWSGWKDGAFTYYSGNLYGLHTDQELAEYSPGIDLIKEGADLESRLASKLESDAHKARTYPY